MNNTLLTTILKILDSDLSKSMMLLQPVAIQLLLWFFMYELVSAMLLSEVGTNPLKVFIDKFKTWAFLYAIIYYFKEILELIKEMFAYFCKVAIGGGSIPDLYEVPQITIIVGFNSMKQIWNYIGASPSTWILLAGLVFGAVVFGKIALTVSMVVIEYMVMSSLVIILIPFMMFKKLSFVGDKVLGTMINLNMKIFVIRYLLTFFSKFITTPLDLSGLNGLAVVESSFYWLVAMAVLGLMTMKGNELASTLISGATTFGDSSELVGAVRGTIAKTVIGAKGAITGAKGAYGGAKTGASTGKAGTISGAVAGAKEGFSKGGLAGSLAGGLAGGIKGGINKYKNSKNSN